MSFRSFKRPTADTLDDDAPLVPAEVVLEPGSRLGSYVIEKIIGSGGSSTVFLVRHVVLSHVRAAKVLHADANPRQLERGRKEASITQLAAHPHIVDVISTGHLADGSVYVVMEYLVGEDLAQRLWRHRQLDPARPWLPDVEVRLWTRQLLAGLAAAHHKGVVHRDLKPENLFLSITDEEPRLKILDFGLARQLDLGDPTKRITTEGQVFGTPHYMAPEQARSARDADVRSDVYAVGVILYQMLTGELPLDGRTPMDVLLSHARRQPDDPRAHRPEIGDPLARLVLRCLEKDPADRFQSANDVAEAFEAAWSSPLPAVDRATTGARVKRWLRSSTAAVTGWLETMTEGLSSTASAHDSSP